ncbi:hypothetical protein F5Y15DRAFT_415230 [Xylariaceae sp. FL0016]|nr:hypothetical protein F5Y15DRAFT_415230 [Xylariaceae sp. FL0016]
MEAVGCLLEHGFFQKNEGIVDSMLRPHSFIGRPHELQLACVRMLCDGLHFHYFGTLFKAGISPDIQDENGNRPLAFVLAVFKHPQTQATGLPPRALAHSFVSSIGTLPTLGCDPNAPNRGSVKPSDLARAQMNYGGSTLGNIVAEQLSYHFEVDERGMRERRRVSSLHRTVFGLLGLTGPSNIFPSVGDDDPSNGGEGSSSHQ